MVPIINFKLGALICIPNEDNGSPYSFIHSKSSQSIRCKNNYIWYINTTIPLVKMLADSGRDFVG